MNTYGLKNLTVAFLASTLALVACESPSDTDDDGTSEGGSGGAPDVEIACKAPTKGPTLHEKGIEADEVWRADEGPHIVKGNLGIRNGATLTIEPCANVELEAGATLAVAFPGTPTTGTLLAEGDAKHPIRFSGKDGARWGHVHVDGGGTARLAHVTLEGGGGFDVRGASLIVNGDDTFPVKKSVFVDHVTVRDSKGLGVRVGRLAAFTADSTDLTVTGSGDEENPFPVMIDNHAIDTLPRGKYTGNQVDKIFLDPEHSLQEDATLKNLGVPYYVGDASNNRLVVGAGPDSPLTTLTIEPGVRMEMFPGTGIRVELVTGDSPASGAIVANGTAADPIVFTSSAAVPQKGDWQGLFFGGQPDASNSISHARIEYTGADCGCILATCSALVEHEGAIILAGEPKSAFVTDTTFAHASNHAIVRAYMGAQIDFKPTNVFEDVTGCQETLPGAPSCPNPKPACE